MTDEIADLRACSKPRPEGPRCLRHALIHGQACRDAIARSLLRYRDERGDDWADIIDILTMYPEVRRGAAAR